MRFFNMAYEFHTQGHIEQAIAYYKKSLEAEPTAEAHTFLGWAYSMQGRLEDAIGECHRAIALDPDYGNPYNDIGAYLMQAGKLDEAIPWFKRSMEVLRYDNPEFPHANLALVYEMKGLWPLALKEFERALALRPDYKVALTGVMRLRANLN